MSSSNPVITLDDILDKISIDPDFGSGVDTILAIILSIYSISGSARSLLEKLVSEDKSVSIYYSPNNLGVDINGDIAIDTSVFFNEVYVDQLGRFVDVDLERVLVHELIHSIEGIPDTEASIGRPLAHQQAVFLNSSVQTQS